MSVAGDRRGWSRLTGESGVGACAKAAQIAKPECQRRTDKIAPSCGPYLSYLDTTITQPIQLPEPQQIRFAHTPFSCNVLVIESLSLSLPYSLLSVRLILAPSAEILLENEGRCVVDELGEDGRRVMMGGTASVGIVRCVPSDSYGTRLHNGVCGVSLCVITFALLFTPGTDLASQSQTTHAIHCAELGS